MAQKVGLLALLATFCVLLWQGGQAVELLKLFQGLSNSSSSLLEELWAVASGMNFWVLVLAVAGLGTLALFASFAIFLLRDQS